MSPPKKPLSFFLIKGFGRDFFSWIVCEYWWSVGLTKEITICCGLMILIYLNITQVWDLFHQFSCKLAKKKGASGRSLLRPLTRARPPAAALPRSPLHVPAASRMRVWLPQLTVGELTLQNPLILSVMLLPPPTTSHPCLVLQLNMPTWQPYVPMS